MLNAVVTDFKALGEEIVTTLDARLKPVQQYLNADNLIEIQQNSFDDIFETLINDVDAVLLIAPESENTLFNLARQVEKAGKRLIGPSSDAIRIATNKAETHRKALDAHVLVPSAIRVGFSEKQEIIDKICQQIGYPVVFKPIDGVGGSGICIVANQKNIGAGLETVQKETTLDTFQIQKYINGLDVSVSAIVSQREVRPISLNAQLVRLAPPGQQSEYQGGYLPISHTLREEAFQNSQKILEHIEGFQGYVGIDFVFSYAPFLIEINPRITTSYIGLREVLSPNPARLILDALQGEIPSKITLTGAAVFSKLELATEIKSLTIPPEFQMKIKISTPPFPHQGSTTIFLVALGSTVNSAQQTLTSFINYMKKIYNL